MARTAITHPLARSEGLLVEDIGDETVVFDTGSKEAHCLSPLAAAVFAAADGSNGVNELAELAGSSVGGAVSAEQVEAALAQLEERRLLAAPPEAPGITRRALVRKTAVATAAVSAAPLVTSIVTPASAVPTTAGTPQPSCPDRSPCASQRSGDDWCGCLNTCPPSTNFPNSQTCNTFEPNTGGAGFGGPFYDSCECERCPFSEAADDEGGFGSDLDLGIALCEATYGENYWKVNNDPNGAWDPNWWTGCSAADVAANQRFGCDEANTTNNAKIDGVCYQFPGDTSEPGFCV